MKATKTLFVSLATLVLLTGCGKKGADPEPEAPNWSSDALALLEEHVPGAVLPYFDLGNYDVYWDETYECVSFEGDKYFEGYISTDITAILDEAGYLYEDLTEDYGFESVSYYDGNTWIDIYGEEGFIEMDVYYEPADAE